MSPTRSSRFPAFSRLAATALLLWPGRVPSVFAQNEEGEVVETFNFTDSTAQTPELLVSETKKAGLKERTAPVNNSGAYEESAGIDLPPGRRGMTPSLSLKYSSSDFRRESPLGAGWSLTLRRMERSVVDGYPPLQRIGGALRYDVARGTYSSPSGTLTAAVGPRPSSALGNLYMPVRERGPVRYEYRHSDDQWIEYDPSGIERYYGLSPNGQRARLVNELGTHAWLLLLERNAQGDTIEYEYHGLDDPATGQDRVEKRRPQAEPVLKRVKWGGNQRSFGSTMDAPHIFQVETKISAQAGPLDLLRGNVLLDARIDAFVVTRIGPPSSHYWTYILKYKASADSGRSLLERIERQAPGESARWTAYEYSGNSTQRPTFESSPRSFAAAGDATLRGVYSAYTAWLDRLPPRYDLEDALSPPHLRSAYRFMDFDGDGQLDVLYHPAGIRTTASRLLFERSFLQSVDAAGTSHWSGVPLEGAPGSRSGLGIPAEQMLTSLNDLDGDQDVDAVAFPVRYASGGGGGGLPPPELGGDVSDICASPGFWNACGHIDPLPPWCREPVFDLTGTPRPGLDRIRSGRPPSDPRGRPGADPATGGGAPMLGPLESGPTLAGPQGMPPGCRQQIFSDPRPRPTPGPRPRPEPRKTKIKWCLDIINACLSTPKDLQPPAGLPTARPIPTGNPIVVYSNSASTATPAMDSRQQMDYWPSNVEHRVRVKSERQPGFIERYSYQTDIITDFQAPLLDVNADGSTDLILLKYMNNTLGSSMGDSRIGTVKFIPRAFVSDGRQFKIDYNFARPTGTDFSASLIDILAGGQVEECRGPACDDAKYPVQINANAFFLDVNSDGLPDLVAGYAPGAKDANGKRLVRQGHRVHLNRGYAWQRSDEIILPGEGWSSPPTTGNAADPATRPSSHPLLRLYNRGSGNLSGSLLFNDFTPVWRYEDEPLIPMAGTAFPDLNGDGRVDIVFAYRVQRPDLMYHRAFLNTGRGFRELPYVNFLPTPTAGGRTALPFFAMSKQLWTAAPFMSDIARFVDVDADGLEDLVYNGACDGGVASLQPDEDGNIDLSSLCSPPVWHRNAGVLPDLLTRSRTDSGSWASVEYVAAASKAAAGVVTGARRPRGTVVVRKIQRADGPASPTTSEIHRFETETITFKYADYAKNPYSPEAIGFGRVEASFKNGNDTTLLLLSRDFDTRTFVATAEGATAPVPHPLAGVETQRSLSFGSYSMTTVSSYALTAAGQAVRVRASGALTRECASAVCRWRGSRVNAFDDLGYPLEVVEGESDGSAVLEDDDAVFTAAVYEHRASPRWITGLLTSRIVCGRSLRLDGSAYNPAGVCRRGQLVSKGGWSYDDRGALTSAIRQGVTAPGAAFPADERRTYAYGRIGLLDSVTYEGRSRKASFEYDPWSLHLATSTISVSRYRRGIRAGSTTLRERYETDLRHGKRAVVVDFNGRRREKTFDSLGRTLEDRGPGGALLTSNTFVDEYPARRESRVFTDAALSFREIVFLDGAGRELAVHRSGGLPNEPPTRQALSRYDAFGRVTRAYLPHGIPDLMYLRFPPTGAGTPNSTLTKYDGFDRKLAVTLPGGRTTHYEHAPRQTTETNPRGIKTGRLYDALGRLSRLVKLDGTGAVYAVSTYQHDAGGRLISMTDPDGGLRRIERDGGGRPHRIELPHPPAAPVQPFVVHFDLDDHPSLIRTPGGRVIKITRDELGRPVSQTATHGRGKVASFLEYDDTAASDGMGRLTRAQDDSGVVTFGYDSFGRRQSLKYEPARALVDAPGAAYTVGFDYSLAGKLRSLSLSGLGTPARFEYARDGLGRITSVRSIAAAGAVRLAHSPVYDAAGRLRSVRYGNGLSASWTYDPANELLSAIEHRGTNGNLMLRSSYSYDENGNPKSEVRTDSGTSFAKAHVFDALDRVSTTTYSGARTGLERYEYTPGDNIVSAAGDAYSYAHPSNPQAVTGLLRADGSMRDLSYDSDGRLESDQAYSPADGGLSARALSYDAAGCLGGVVATDSVAGRVIRSSTSTYVCGQGGRRVFRKTVEGSATSRVLTLADAIELRLDEGLALFRIPVLGRTAVEEARILSGGGRVDSKSGYVHDDLRRSILMTTRYAAGGAPVSKADYDAWGATIAISGLPPPVHGFVGSEPDPHVGYHSFGRRLYDPTLRRWLSPDPLLSLLPELDTGDGGQLNLYAYAANNPVALTDESGEEVNIISYIPMLGPTLDAQRGVDEAMVHFMDGRTAEGFEAAGWALADTAFAIMDAVTLGGAGLVRNGFLKSGETALRAEGRNIGRAEAKTYQTYTRTHPDTGDVYAGRTSGTGTPQDNLTKRGQGADHRAMDEQGFGPLELDKSSESKDAIRGREQILIDDAKAKGKSANKINGISPTNPKKEQYMDAAKKLDEI